MRSLVKRTRQSNALTVDAELNQQLKKPANEKRRAGRYTLEEAARRLEDKAGERFDTARSALMSAAKSGELPMYNPGENIRRDYAASETKQVRYFFEEATGNDLNAWLNANAPRVKYRFPASSETIAEEKFLAEENAASHSVSPGARQDILTPVILDAIRDAETDETSAVWLVLKDYALEERPPFKMPQGGALIYTDRKDNVRKFTRQALEKRLKRRRDRAAKGR